MERTETSKSPFAKSKQLSLPCMTSVPMHSVVLRGCFVQCEHGCGNQLERETHESARQEKSLHVLQNATIAIDCLCK